MTLDQFIQTFGETPDERWRRTIGKTLTPAETVLKGHAFVESELDAVIQSQLRRPTLFERRRPPFAQKVGLAAAMIGDDFDDELVQLLDSLDELKALVDCTSINGKMDDSIRAFISSCLSQDVSDVLIATSALVAVQFICTALCCSIRRSARSVRGNLLVVGGAGQAGVAHRNNSAPH